MTLSKGDTKAQFRAWPDGEFWPSDDRSRAARRPPGKHITTDVRSPHHAITYRRVDSPGDGCRQRVRAILRNPGRPEVIRIIDFVEPDHRPGERCVDHVPAAHVDPDVMDGPRVRRVVREEDQVTREKLVPSGMRPSVVLVVGDRVATRSRPNGRRPASAPSSRTVRPAPAYRFHPIDTCVPSFCCAK